MTYNDKTKQELIDELAALRRRVAELEAAETEQTQGSDSALKVFQKSERRLEEALAELRAARRQMKAEGQMAVGIAHELNDLMTVVGGYAELLRTDPEVPESIHEELTRIIEQGQRGSRLVRQILYFTRKTIHQPQPANLVSFVKEAAILLERALPTNIRILIECDAEELPVEADLTQLQQMLANLAVNARDAMPDGGDLRLKLSRFSLKSSQGEMRAGEWGALSVSDSGEGIPPDVLPRIFEPFFTTKGPGEGIGLGLAQVKGIVEQHNGYIDIASQPGQGTTFTVYLPLKVVERAPEEAPAELPRGSGQTILLVEDEPDVLEVGRAMLAYLGYQVLTASDGHRALELYEKHQDEIALVISDAVMPEMEGKELFRALKAKNPDVKMVMITGYPMQTERDTAQLLDEGLINWVEKPPTLHRMAQVLSRALQAGS